MQSLRALPKRLERPLPLKRPIAARRDGEKSEKAEKIKTASSCECRKKALKRA